MTTANRERPCLASSSRINHLGINPVRGGSPPKESSVIAARGARTGNLVQDKASVPMFIEEVILKVRKAAEVIVI